jgi:hypothetical protein
MGLSATEPGPDPVQLDPGLIEEIADRVSDAIVQRVVEAIRAEGIMQQGHASMAWLDAKAVAQLLAVDRDWVYEHADELGASRIGRGPRPRLRFPPDVLERQGCPRPSSEPTDHPDKRRPKTSGLIPIRGS